MADEADSKSVVGNHVRVQVPLPAVVRSLFLQASFYFVLHNAKIMYLLFFVFCKHYRYWHFYTDENSKQIYAQADGPLMRSCYLGFHMMDVAMAVEDLKEIYKQKQKAKSS